jgi:uncharacterized membrane protein
MGSTHCEEFEERIMTATFILMLIAVILLFLAAIPLPWQSPVSIGWLGMFFFALTFLIGK